MFEKINQQHWISLPRETRQHLVKVFGLIPNGIAEIRDQSVVSDGYTNSDLERITAEKMAEYVGSTESFSRLWELTLSKVKYELNPPMVMQGAAVTSLVPPLIQIPERTLTSAPFCDKCDSKGGRHKKECPKLIPVSNPPQNNVK